MALRVRIRGRVQGVGYRAWAVDQARAGGLNGWVRNRSDGSVEALFHGSDEAVKSVIERCREGPPGARVSDIDANEDDEVPGPGFEQRPTL